GHSLCNRPRRGRLVYPCPAARQSAGAPRTAKRIAHHCLMKDFVPIAPINYSDLVLVVHPSLPVKSVKELVALAKSKPRGLNYASSGTGTPYHMAPAGTPKPVIDRLNAEITKIVSRPDVKKAWSEQGAEPMTMTVGEFEKYLNADAKWAKVVKFAGARADR
ncbi:MAG: hypothetical protein HY525_04205, partial [Betaproteobacteria bacterium]|nr:hypothetical protein [Betaproteobacteria bacterium]